MKYILKNLISILPREIIGDLKKQLKLPIVNFYRTNFQQNVLISYIRKPFKKGSDFTHTNGIETLAIAEIFSELKYNVDVVNFDYEGFIDYQKYDIIFGFGEPLNNCFAKKKNKTTAIYYGTGMHECVQNYNTLSRIEDVYKKKGKWLLNSGRIVEKTWSKQTTLVDAIITLGNDFVKESYSKYFNKTVYLIPPSFIKLYDYKKIIEKKNFEKAIKNYLWFGSDGKIHKGLDLLLDYFPSHPEIHLHICCSFKNEEEFKKIYEKELLHTPNIHYHGFVLLNSPKFEKLLIECGFVIFPSCSEAGGPSVLNVSGNGGIIPIISKESTIDFDEFTIEIKTLDQDGIENAIFRSQSFKIGELKEKSMLCGNAINLQHSLNNFKDTFKKCLEEILSKNYPNQNNEIN